MANEAEIINNPDSTPGAVSTGYQAQNTNLVAQRTGIDKTYVSGGVGTVTVEISGPVDVNGVLYDVKSQTVLTPPSAGRYYITLQGAGPQYLTPTLGTSAGTFDPLKNARYDANNYRVLNWVIYFDGTDCYANRLLTPESEHTEIEDLDTPEETFAKDVNPAADTFEINLLDTVIFEPTINEREFSTWSQWIVKECDPGQDVIKMEGLEKFYPLTFDAQPATLDGVQWIVSGDIR